MKEETLKFNEARGIARESMNKEIHKSIDEGGSANEISGMIAVRDYLNALEEMLIAIVDDLTEIDEKINEILGKDKAQ